MSFGAYIKELRNKSRLSQRELEKLSNVSNAEISRIETGDRKNPSPLSLKAIAPHLGVSYAELMQKAGYLEEVIPRGNFEDVVWKDSAGEPLDTFRRQAEKIQRRDPELISILDRAVDTSSDQDIDTIKKILSGFMEDGMDESQKAAIRAVMDSFKK